MNCPRCGAECGCDEVDVGVGVMTGPYYCFDCDCGWDQQPPPKVERKIEPPPACINCDIAFVENGVRYYFGAHQVGPFCQVCDRIIKTHMMFQEAE